MKNKIKTIKSIILNACLYFTAAFFIIIAAADLFELAPTAYFLSLGSSALIFLACLLMSVLNLVWRLDYSAAVRTLIHFSGSFAIYGIIFILIPKAYKVVSQLAIRSIVFVIAYALVAFVVMLILSIRRNRRSDDMEYESQFGNFFDK